jgi:hypothetical protein
MDGLKLHDHKWVEKFPLNTFVRKLRYDSRLKSCAASKIYGERVIQRDIQHNDWTLQAPTQTRQSVKSSCYNNTKMLLAIDGISNEYLANLCDFLSANHKGIVAK